MRGSSQASARSSASAPSSARLQSQVGERAAGGARPGSTIERVSAPVGAPPRIQIPRWIQLVGLPLLVVLRVGVGEAAGHTVFLFLVAALIALLLDPIVRGARPFRVRRGFSVALVYLDLRGGARS